MRCDWLSCRSGCGSLVLYLEICNQTEPKGLLHNRHGSVVTFTSIKHLPIRPTHCLPFSHIPGPHRKPICDDVTSRISYFGTLTVCADLMPNDTQTWKGVHTKKMCIRNLDPGIYLQSVGLIH